MAASTSSPTLILDNGAHSIKALWADSSLPPQTFRNAITKSKTEKRSYIADELEECADYGGLVFRLPFERGILTNWEVEKTVWDRVLGAKGRGMKVDPSSTRLLITEPVLNLPNVQEHYDQMIFEEYEFASYLRCPGPSLVPFGAEATAQGVAECVLVVDSGFSFTHVVPVVKGTIVASGVRRIDVGGKLLTNYLKELVSFRHWYMMDQTSVIEKVKEDCCYVTERWDVDWELASSTNTDMSIVRTYVLPDFVPTSSNKLGYVRMPPTGETPPPEEPEEIPMEVDDKGKGKAKEGPQEEQLLQMGNERFTVPEVLFNPSTIGLNQSGLAETIARSISSLPEELRGMFWSNIVCVGGNSGFAGFIPRLERELRSLAPEDYDIRVVPSSSPTLSTILSASAALAANPRLQESFISRAEYQEGGSNAVRRKFGKLYYSDQALRDDLDGMS